VVAQLRASARVSAPRPVISAPSRTGRLDISARSGSRHCADSTDAGWPIPPPASCSHAAPVALEATTAQPPTSRAAQPRALAPDSHGARSPLKPEIAQKIARGLLRADRARVLAIALPIHRYVCCARTALYTGARLGLCAGRRIRKRTRPAWASVAGSARMGCDIKHTAPRRAKPKRELENQIPRLYVLAGDNAPVVIPYSRCDRCIKALSCMTLAIMQGRYAVVGCVHPPGPASTCASGMAPGI